MFSNETNGYNKKEVDSYIEELKTQYETQIMEERLKALESETKFFEIKKANTNLEAKINNMVAAVNTLSKAKEFEEKGLKNLYSLKIKQINLITDKTDYLVNELENLENKPEKIINDFKSLLLLCKKIKKEENGIDLDSPFSNTFKLLLERMNQYQNKNPKEVKIERKKVNLKAPQIVPIPDDEKTQIKPVTDLTLDENENFDNLVDKFLSTKPDEETLYKDLEFQSNAFDLTEALNPKDDLDEIMKAFDFYNNN